MAFNELERKRIEKTLDRFIQAHRPPPHIPNELDLGFRLQGQNVELFEVRPVWDNPSQKMETPVAKTTYVKTQDLWKIYWMPPISNGTATRPRLKWIRSMPFLPWWLKTNMRVFLAEPFRRGLHTSCTIGAR